MFKKDEKYTIEEFKKMFDEAVVEALAELKNDMKKAQIQKDGLANDLSLLMFEMQNMLTAGMIKTKLFKEEK